MSISEQERLFLSLCDKSASLLGIQTQHKQLIRYFSVGFYFREVSEKLNSREMAKSLCRLLIQVKHDLVVNFSVANMSLTIFVKTLLSRKVPNLQ